MPAHGTEALLELATLALVSTKNKKNKKLALNEESAARCAGALTRWYILMACIVMAATMVYTCGLYSYGLNDGIYLWPV